MDLIFLEPIFREKIWGGAKLRDEFGMDIPSSMTGEAWVISAHKNGATMVKSPEIYSNMSFDELYKNHRELFGEGLDDTFPLLVKILDASDDLSVQVHPDNDYAREHEGEGELGKTECWYVLAADEGAQIVYGHNAKTKEEFVKCVDEGRWDRLLRKVNVKKGDFFNVPYGTIHAIGKGILILEVQQSSDTTYRVYDYDRVDDSGCKRELHIEDSINVAKIPHIDPVLDILEDVYDGGVLETLLTNEFFTVYRYVVDGSILINLDDSYYLMTVIDGRGSVILDGHVYDVSKGDSFMVPIAATSIEMKGSLEIISSRPN